VEFNAHHHSPAIVRRACSHGIVFTFPESSSAMRR
jgi:hypothetical protein